jgi:hypothetical protein
MKPAQETKEISIPSAHVKFYHNLMQKRQLYIVAKTEESPPIKTIVPHQIKIPISLARDRRFKLLGLSTFKMRLSTIQRCQMKPKKTLLQVHLNL